MEWQQFCSAITVGTLIVTTPTLAGVATHGAYPVQVMEDAFTLGVKNVSVNPSDSKVWLKFIVQPFTTVGGGVNKYVLDNGLNGKVDVYNCSTLFKADFDGFRYLQSTIGGWRGYREWAYNCYNALFVHLMKPSKRSYLLHFKLTSSTVKQLPADMMSSYEFENPNEGMHLPGDIGSVLPTHPAKIDYDTKKDGVTINYLSGGIQSFNILARGDFNYDGVEDLLIGVYYAIGGRGTLTYNESFIITRTQSNGPFRILKGFWPTEGQYPFKQWVKIGP